MGKGTGKKIAALGQSGTDRELTPRKRFYIPADNIYFTGREEYLAELHQQLRQNGAAVISGLGGVGKSQTAIEYAHRYAKPNDSYEQCYDWAFWVKADTDLNLESDFAEIARQVGIAQTGQTNPELAQSAKHWLETTGDRWLLIFDNADTPKLLKPYRCQNPQGRTLLTSRKDSFAVLGIRQPLALEVLSEAEAVSFLWERIEQVRPDRQTAEALAAVELAQELGYLPLALEQAAAYIAQKQTYFERYLPSYRKRQLQLLETHAPETGDYPLSVATTWQLNFEQVEQSNPAAADVLRLSAFLAADDIPCELLVRGAAHLGEAIATALKDFQEDPVVLDEVLSALTQYSLIRRNPEAFCYSLHRLVQLVQRHNMSPEERTLWCDRAVAGLNNTFPNPEFENWKKCKRFILHIADLWTHQPTASLSWARVLHQTSYYICHQGRFKTAIIYSERSLQIRETQLGQDHLDTANSLNNLAELYRLMGRYSKAEPLYVRSLQIRKTQLGKDHPDIAQSLNNLTLLYKAMGRYSEAESLYMRSLQIREIQLGQEHPHTAISFNNLAALYSLMGRYSEAEPLCEQSLQIYETQLGKEHPDTATSLNNLAELYQSMGHYSKAEPLYVRSLQIYETQLGKEHPRTAQSLNNLAGLYQSMGRYSEAESLYMRSLQIYETQLGEDHPDIAQSLNNLALLYQLMGRYSEAESLYMRSLQIYETQLGKDHPDIATCLNNLAELYQSIGRYSEAEPLYVRSLQIRETELGQDHPYTANSLNNLAELYRSIGRYSEAEPLYLQTLEIFVECLGANHPHTQTVWSNFCYLIQQVVESDRTQELSSHPITQSLLQEIQAQDE